MRTDKLKNNSIPQFEIDSLAKLLLPKMQAYFESEQGKREFEEWKEKQEHKQ
ncbi:MAG: hypothetical protein FWE04_03665 [Oscillospiraceae bacterium]|nr:hypothetical protein [Oscillospiraceae bacterium]